MRMCMCMCVCMYMCFIHMLWFMSVVLADVNHTSLILASIYHTWSAYVIPDQYNYYLLKTVRMLPNKWHHSIISPCTENELITCTTYLDFALMWWRHLTKATFKFCELLTWSVFVRIVIWMSTTMLVFYVYQQHGWDRPTQSHILISIA